ncbi:MAG: hypothetical protein KH382_06750 [Clostridiales bacterium]|jgi:hypothetical protein|nr:hypothetical protein [Clostridiales bacterium]
MKPLFETMTFHNSRPLSDNLKALSFDTVPSKLSAFSVVRYHEHKHFAGEISETDGTFRIYPIVSYRSSFLPSIIHGSITKENGGSKIELIISPPELLRIFFIFLLSFACLILLFAILMKPFSILMLLFLLLIFLAFFLSAYGMMYRFYRKEAKKCKERLTSLF